MVNIILATTKPRNSRVAKDLEDYLIIKLGNAKVTKSRFSGLLIIETELDPTLVSRIILRSPFAGTVLFRVIPIIEYTNELNLGDLVNLVLRRINQCSGHRLLIRCRARGRGVSDSDCELRLARMLKERGVNVGVKSPGCILLIECWEQGCGVLMDRIDLIKEYALINIK
ncbi:THUMP domain-containing protein [Caldivirga sp. UBA161]|uniref:THUMP domain-containing protein n=1 Tax=Caldivirga sp. UBA161 TaxID=1915569 RepID=UPI0025BB3F17|nr:THUMP domain-containing protein [Caldivirga sp. UBA161]